MNKKLSLQLLLTCIFVLITRASYAEVPMIDRGDGYAVYPTSSKNEELEDLKEPAKELFNLFGDFGATGVQETQPNQNTTPDSEAFPSPVSQNPKQSKQTIGQSTNGNPIEVYEFWNGEDTSLRRVVFVGGIHGGYEWNSVLLAYQAIDYFSQNPTIIPQGIKVQVIPVANPDGLKRIVGQTGRFSPPWNSLSEQSANISQTRPGRFNGNMSAPRPNGAPYEGVDLNRNWSCRHSTTAYWGDVVVSGGASPFSEKETQVLKTFFETDKPAAVVYWHSQWGAIFPGGCDQAHEKTLLLRDAYAKASGYEAKPWYKDSGITGDATDWLASIDVPAIVVELKNHTETDWAENLGGIKATLAFAAPEIPSGQAIMTPAPQSGKYTMYRQSDYSDRLPDDGRSCTLSQSGCGPSTVANIVANWKNPSIRPPDVIRHYGLNTSANRYLGCGGSTMAGAKEVLEQVYGFKTQIIIKEGSSPMTLEQAIPKLLPFIRSGSWIFVGGNFQTFTTGGHYVVIVDIKETGSGYEIYALDSAYGNRNVIPVNYNYMYPKPYIKKAMAVRP